MKKVSNFIKNYILSNNTIVFLFFIGLALTSIGHPLLFDISGEHGEADSYIALTGWYITNNNTGFPFKMGYAERFGLLGMICLGVALLIPLLNWCRYRAFKNYLRESGYVKLGNHGASVKIKTLQLALRHFRIRMPRPLFLYTSRGPMQHFGPMVTPVSM